MDSRHLQHPDITSRMEYGILDDGIPRCPICGRQCDTFYMLTSPYGAGGVFGCENCITTKDAYEFQEQSRWDDE